MRSIKTKETWEHFKPHMEMVITQYIFPQTCYSEQDDELWNDDPIEYVRKKFGMVTRLTYAETHGLACRSI